MTDTSLGEGENSLNPENIHSSLVGLAVDYLTRIATGTCPEEVFTVAQGEAPRFLLRKDMVPMGNSFSAV